MKVKKLLKHIYYGQKIRIMEYGIAIEVEEGQEIYSKGDIEEFKGLLEMKVEYVSSNENNELVIHVELGE